MKYELEEGNVPVGFSPGNGEVIEVTRRKKESEPLPPYSIVGNGFTNRHGTSVDVLEICLQLNMAEMKLMQFFRNAFTMNSINRDEAPNIIEPLKWEEFDKYLATALMKNFKHMEYLQVIRRIKRGIYILNPKVFIPSRGYLLMNSKWEQIIIKDNDAI